MEVKRQYKGLTSYQVRRINRGWVVVEVCRCLWDDFIWYSTPVAKCKTRSIANKLSDDLDYVGWGYPEGSVLKVVLSYGDDVEVLFV